MQELHQRLLARANELERQASTLQVEVTRRRSVEEQLRHDAQHDGLTLLPNRSLLTERINRAMARLRRFSGSQCAVIYLDLDNFKVINDSLGHNAGDELLVEVARRITSCIRDNDAVCRADDVTTARLGGDEFVVLLEGVQDALAAFTVAERISHALAQPFCIKKHDLKIGASVGIAMAQTGYETTEDLLREADTAMYTAKTSGKGRATMFDQQMHDAVAERLKLEGDLRAAIDEHKIELFYQPILSLDSAELAGFEALVRWRNNVGHFVPPLIFIPVAEDAGLITVLGRWVLRTACKQMRTWLDAYPGRNLYVSVNVSRQQIVGNDLFQDIQQALRDHNLPGNALKIEITESVIMSSVDTVQKVLERIRALGVQVMMDDFGTGYSSLSCLHHLSIDALKIDRAFLHTMGSDRRYAAVLDAIINLAHLLEKTVICEGIEKSEQLAQMLALDCEYGQGYLFSPPLPAVEAERMLRDDHSWCISA